MATSCGAAALDLPVGAIVPGLRADLVLVRLDGFHVQPCVADTLATNLVHAARGSDVSMVMVDGQVVVKDGRTLPPVGGFERPSATGRVRPFLKCAAAVRLMSPPIAPGGRTLLRGRKWTASVLVACQIAGFA